MDRKKLITFGALGIGGLVLLVLVLRRGSGNADGGADNPYVGFGQFLGGGGYQYTPGNAPVSEDKPRAPGGGITQTPGSATLPGSTGDSGGNRPGAPGSIFCIQEPCVPGGSSGGLTPVNPPRTSARASDGTITTDYRVGAELGYVRPTIGMYGFQQNAGKVIS